MIYCYHYICLRLLLFSDINVSQGSVAIFVRFGGIFSYSFLTNLLLSPLVKRKLKSAFGEVADKSIVVPFFSRHSLVYFCLDACLHFFVVLV